MSLSHFTTHFMRIFYLSAFLALTAIVDTDALPAESPAVGETSGSNTSAPAEVAGEAAIPILDPATILSNETVEIEALVTQGQDVDALVRSHRGLMQSPDNLSLLHIKGGIQRRLKDHSGAMVTYERILSIAPEDPVAAPLLALILQEISHTVSPPEAMKLLSKALALVDVAPGIRMDYASAAAADKQHGVATETYETLPQELQQNAELMRAVASSYSALKELDKATMLYARLIEIDPRDTRSARRMVELLREGGKDAEALARLSAALEADPENVILLLLQAEISAKDGAVWSEIRSLARITRLRPGNRKAVSRQVDRLLAVGCVGLASEVAQRQAALLSEQLSSRVTSEKRILETKWKTVESALQGTEPGDKFRPVFLAYGDIRWSSSGTANILDVPSLIQQIEYLRAHGYTFVSPVDVGAKQRGKRELPDKAVMLMFNHGYASFARNVLPLLEIYGIPAIVGLSSGWIDSPRSSRVTGELMDWKTLATISSHPRVTLASMTHALGSHTRVNPQGRLALASVSRRYDPKDRKYETMEEYHLRVEEDLQNSIATIRRKTGKQVDILIWPEGRYNATTLAKAIRADFMIMFGARALTGSGPDRRVIPQRPVPGNIKLAEFARRVQSWATESAPPTPPTRAMPVNLDDIHSKSPEDLRQNIAALLARVDQADVNTVYLRAYADPRGSGNAKSVYFPNRVLPVEADLLSHVAARLRYGGVRVFVSMPALSVTPPDIARDARFFVMEYRWGRVQPMSEWNRRLSPFHPRTRDVMVSLYEDLAAHIECDGFLIENDAYLSDSEDFSPEAAKLYREELNILERNPEVFKPKELKRWSDRKQKQLDLHVAALRNAIRRTRPHALIGRSLHTATLWDPKASEWLAQNYSEALKHHDFLVIPVSPENYKTESSTAWISQLGKLANQHHSGLEKTVFSLEVLNPESQRWLSRRFWQRRVDALIEGGASHISYYPDRGASSDLPELGDIRDVMGRIPPSGATLE